MTSMTHDAQEIIGGVDTHGLTHHAAVIDPIGRHLADREFAAGVRGYRDLLDWMRSHGTLSAVGVEGTGAYGAELARVLAAAGVAVLDVDRPDRKTRRMKGKSDPIDAYATAVLSGRATGVLIRPVFPGQCCVTKGRIVLPTNDQRTLLRPDPPLNRRGLRVLA